MSFARDIVLSSFQCKCKRLECSALWGGLWVFRIIPFPGNSVPSRRARRWYVRPWDSGVGRQNAEERRMQCKQETTVCKRWSLALRDDVRMPQIAVVGRFSRMCGRWTGIQREVGRTLGEGSRGPKGAEPSLEAFSSLETSCSECCSELREE